MTDAATRFYQRSHERSLGGEVQAIAGDALIRSNHRYSAVYRYLSEHPELTVGELGYGGPSMLALLAPLAREYHLVDIVDRTREVELQPNIVARTGNLDNDWPFDDGLFDVVVALMIIEHLYDPFHAFAELARILRPGGKAFVNLPNIASLRCRLQLLRGQMPVTSSKDWFEKREWDGNHLHFFTVADVERIAALNGLTVSSMEVVGAQPRVKALWPSLLCHEITYVLTR